MAHIYDYIYDSIGVPRFIDGLPGWIVIGLFLMDIQFILAIIVGLCACMYVLKKISRQFYRSDATPACEECKVDHRQGDLVGKE